MSYEDENNNQDGPSVWADAPQPVPPPMRTFKVILDGRPDVFVDAHSVTCKGKVAKFYTYRAQAVENVPILMAFCTRVLRPYLDLEDVSCQLAATSKAMN